MSVQTPATSEVNTRQPAIWVPGKADWNPQEGSFCLGLQQLVATQNRKFATAEEQVRETTSAGFSLGQRLLTGLPTFVPNGKGKIYKLEYVLGRYNHPQDEENGETAKVNVWALPDIDRGEETEPHNHPWPFRSWILSGRYTEQRFYLDAQGNLQTEEHTYSAGDWNIFPPEQYHYVTSVEPGTTTLMLCGPNTFKTGEWGYLERRTKMHRKAVATPEFLKRLQDANPHKKLFKPS